MAYIQANGVRIRRKKSKWRKLKGSTVVSIISLLIAAYFAYQNTILSSQSYSLNQENFRLQNYFPSLYSYYNESTLDESISTSLNSLVEFFGTVTINLDDSTPHSSIVIIELLQLNFTYGDSMGILDLGMENHSQAVLFGRTSYEYIVTPTSPKISDGLYVKVDVYLRPQKFSEFPTTLYFPIGELVFKATITDRTNNQSANLEFKEGIRGQVKFVA